MTLCSKPFPNHTVGYEKLSKQKKLHYMTIVHFGCPAPEGLKNQVAAYIGILSVPPI